MTVKLEDTTVAEFANLQLANEYCSYKNTIANVGIAQQQYYPDTNRPNIDIGIKLIYAAIEEFVEALRELPSRKSWASKQYANRPPNWSALTKELVDVQLFLYAILYWLNIDYESFMAQVLTKQIANKTRKDHANLQR